MARSVRMDYPATFYHVLSRGNERRKIFRDQRDYERFIDTIGRMVGRYHIEVHAYVLMGNHYHLLLRTQEGNLSRAIQWLGLTYSVWFNRRHKRSGHLFQGRFKSFIVEDDSYFTAMCLYIHRNPIRARIADRLLDYPWSSYPAYVKPRKAPPWLTTSLVLGVHGRSRKRFIEAQRSYAKEEKALLTDLRYGLVLGSEAFVSRLKKKLEKERHREKPQVRKVLRERSIEELLDHTIFPLLGVKDGKGLLRPVRRTSRPERDLAIYILCHLGFYTNQEVGSVFGVGYTSITGALKRAEAYMAEIRKARRKVDRILNDIAPLGVRLR